MVSRTKSPSSPVTSQGQQTAILWAGSRFVAFETGGAVPDQSAVLAEEVKALILGTAHAQIADCRPALDKEVLGKLHAFMASGELFQIPMDDQWFMFHG